MDETQLDQISIPPLCRGVSEMAHTLVGKAVPLQLHGPGFKPQWGQSAGLPAGSRTPWENFFSCALILSPLFGDPRECRGDVAFPPSFGPALICPLCWGSLRMQG